MKRQALCLFLPVFLVGIAVAEPFQFVENNEKKQLSLSEGTLPILTYQYDAIEHDHVPSRDLRRLAGCYVHPLHGLRGEILTDNAPTDHFHHHGVFWTWPHVGVHEPDGKVTEYDLWTSNGTLKQYFVRWIDKTISEQSAVIEAENGWFIGKPQEGKKIMTERVKITVHRVVSDLAGFPANRTVDFEFLLQPTDKAITLRGSEGKSYGGFTVRLKPFVATEQREARRSEINAITVPTGIAAGDLPETPLAWADYTSVFSDDQKPSGVAVFIPKTHPDFPPTWLTRYYGPLCVGWPGVEGKTFKPGEKIELKYRMWIHDGAVTLPQIEKAYTEYNKE